MKIIVGSSGYSYKFWGPHPTNPDVQNYYPSSMNSKAWLRFYSSQIKSVEINMTRYRKLTPNMCRKWVSEVPRDFIFTIKAGTYITHGKKLNDFEAWWKDFEICLDEIPPPQLGAILFQFPPVFHMTEANLIKLQKMKEVIPERYTIALEFRDSGWYQDDERVLSLFEISSSTSLRSWLMVNLHLPDTEDEGWTFGDLPEGMHSLFHRYGSPHSKIEYHRLHGTTGYSFGTYTYRYLNSLVQDAKRRGVKELYIYFNNTDTWTVEPELYYGETDLTSIGYDMGVAVGVKIVPSAILNTKHILEIKETLRSKYEFDEDGYLSVDFQFVKIKKMK